MRRGDTIHRRSCSCAGDNGRRRGNQGRDRSGLFAESGRSLLRQSKVRAFNPMMDEVSGGGVIARPDGCEARNPPSRFVQAQLTIKQNDAFQDRRKTAGERSQKNVIHRLIAHRGQSDLPLRRKANQHVGWKVRLDFVVCSLAAKPHEEGTTGNSKILRPTSTAQST